MLSNGKVSVHDVAHLWVKDFIHSFILAISIAPLQVHYYSEMLSTQHGYCVKVSHWSPRATASEGLTKVPTLGLERDLNQRPFRQKVSNLPMSHHTHKLRNKDSLLGRNHYQRWLKESDPYSPCYKVITLAVDQSAATRYYRFTYVEDILRMAAVRYRVDRLISGFSWEVC